MTDTTTITTPAEVVAEAFRHWDAVPALSNYTDAAQLRRDYEHQSGPTHYWEAATVRVFGSRHPAMAAPGIYIETQTNAPAGYPAVLVVAWVWDENEAADHRGGPRLTPKTLTCCHTRQEARRFAAEVVAAWPTV